MTAEKNFTEKSKLLSWLLRHGAAEKGLEVDPAGWVPVEQVIDYLRMTKEDLVYVVENNNKKRLQITNNHIRACQGHSTDTMPVKLEALEESWEIVYTTDPLWHGTKLDAIGNISIEGLLPIKRTHVHLAPSPDALVGKRHNVALLLEISTILLQKRGIKIFQSPNGVILVRQVPRDCIVCLHLLTKAAKAKQSELAKLFITK